MRTVAQRRIFRLTVFRHVELLAMIRRQAGVAICLIRLSDAFQDSGNISQVTDPSTERDVATVLVAITTAISRGLVTVVMLQGSARRDRRNGARFVRASVTVRHVTMATRVVVVRGVRGGVEIYRYGVLYGVVMRTGRALVPDLELIRHRLGVILRHRVRRDERSQVGTVIIFRSALVVDRFHRQLRPTFQGGIRVQMLNACNIRRVQRDAITYM